MYTWNIQIHIRNIWSDQNISIEYAKQTFLKHGFTVLPPVDSYYNPHRRRQFTVQHSRASAITVFMLSWDNSSMQITAESAD